MGRSMYRAQGGISADQVLAVVDDVLAAPEKRSAKRRKDCMEQNVRLMERLISSNPVQRVKIAQLLLKNAEGLLGKGSQPSVELLQNYADQQLGRGRRAPSQLQATVRQAIEKLQAEVDRLAKLSSSKNKRKKSGKLSGHDDIDPEKQRMIDRKNRELCRDLRNMKIDEDCLGVFIDILTRIHRTPDASGKVLTNAFITLDRIIEAFPEEKSRLWRGGEEQPLTVFEEVIAICISKILSNKEKFDGTQIASILCVLIRLGFIDWIEEKENLLRELLDLIIIRGVSPRKLSYLISRLSKTGINLEPQSDQIGALIDQYIEHYKTEAGEIPATDDLRRLCRGLILMQHEKALEVIGDYRAMRGNGEKRPDARTSLFEKEVVSAVRGLLGKRYKIESNIYILEVFEVDVLVTDTLTGERIIIEADGEDFHDEIRDRKRDESIRTMSYFIDDNEISTIIRIRTQDFGERDKIDLTSPPIQKRLVRFVNKKLSEGGLELAA